MSTHVLPTPRRRGWQLAIAEAVLMTAVMVTALSLRFGHDTLLLLRDVAGRNCAILCFACLLAFYLFDLYESPVVGDLREIGARLPQALGMALLMMAAAERWLPGLSFAQRTWVEALAAAGLALCLFRAVYLFWHHHPRLSEPVLLVGEGRLAGELQRELRRHAEVGLPVVGTLGISNPDDLASLVPLRDRGSRHLVRRLIAAFPGGWRTIEPGLRRKLERAGYKLDDGAEVYERLTGRLPLQAWAQAEVAFRADGGLRGAVLAGKRMLDSALASLLLAALAPWMLLVAVLIRLDSPGPAIFRQQRVGRHGRLFTLYKFRSMRVNADAGGPARPAGKNDARCTRLGRWLRRLRLDELPQLWNIVRGDMSLVGPRPFVPEQEEEYRHLIPYYEQRWAVLPGATGWAQVNRAYCATLDDNAEKLAYDLFYIRNLSLVFDVLILMQTFKVVFFGRGGR